MFGLGTIVNTLAILGGSFAGLLMRRGMPERLKETLQGAIGLSVVLLGISGVMTGMLRTQDGGSLERVDLMVLIISMMTGAVIGELINIDRYLNRFGEFLASKLMRGGNEGEENTFAQGFSDATILYCVGAMAIVGALEDGLLGNPDTLYAKAALDGITSVILASGLGVGVAASAISVFLYQGSITCLAMFIKPLMFGNSMGQLSMVGSALIMCIGFNVLKVTNIRVANLLPAAFMPIIWGIINNFMR